MVLARSCEKEQEEDADRIIQVPILSIRVVVYVNRHLHHRSTRRQHLPSSHSTSKNSHVSTSSTWNANHPTVNRFATRTKPRRVGFEKNSSSSVSLPRRSRVDADDS